MRNVIAALLLACSAAGAGEITLDWANPTEQEQCVPAGPTSIDGIHIWQRVYTIASPTEVLVIPGKLPGEYVYAATAFNAQGESRLSNVATKTVTEFTAPAGATAYQVVTIASGFWMIPMATLDADTQCDVSQSANGMYRVPPGSYTWNAGVTARPVLLLATCE